MISWVPDICAYSFEGYSLSKLLYQSLAVVYWYKVTLCKLSLSDGSIFDRDRLVLNWIENHREGFNMLPWHAPPTDLNPIKNLLEEVERWLQSLETPLHSLTQTGDVSMSAWANISQQQGEQQEWWFHAQRSAMLRQDGPTCY